MNIDISKIRDTFGYRIYDNKFRAEITLNNKKYNKLCETEEECINYIINIIGEEEYNKRRFFAFNRNFNKYIQDNNNLLSEKQNEIWQILNKKYNTLGGNKGRVSHIKKNKNITLFEIYTQLVKQDWKCYYSKLDFDSNINYLCPSIERSDSNLDYTKDNCVIVLEFCNNFKSSYSILEFKRCVISIATGILQDCDNETINKLIGGGKKKGIKDWKQVDLSRPLHMSDLGYYIYEILKNNDEYFSRIEITDLIKDKYNIDASKPGLLYAFRNMINNNYLIVDKSSTCWKYKLETKDNIKKINENTNLHCGCCNKEHNILHFRKREARGKNKLDLNLYYTLCTECNTKCTNKYKNKSMETFILRHIGSSNNNWKKGNITKENISQINGFDGKCAISGLPLLIENNSGKFNQASCDRINSSFGYDIDNTQIICLALNLAKNEYVISNDTILNIIKNIYSNISNF
jgi:hypothetical protein